MPEEVTSAAFGPNAWLVDEMYERYRQDPSSVSESWREFFADYRRGDEPSEAQPPVAEGDGIGPIATPSTNGAPAPAPAAADRVAEPAGDQGAKGVAEQEAAEEGPAEEDQDRPEPLRGAAARVAANMRASLEVPTATSVREVPARLLEVNRKIINNHLARGRGGKVSFTHLIAYAVVKALAHVPAMNSQFIESIDEKGTPGVVRHHHAALGIAVDHTRPDGSRTLLVPVIKNADTLAFRAFWLAYEDLIRKVRNNKVSADDLSGATLSITNPGTIGTVHSVPRLMPGQGVIVGVGAIEHPAAYQAADRRMLAELGVGKVVTLTSTYDHRIIQGAESGEFLARVHALLLGEHGFYDDIFRSVGVPYEPVRWRPDVNPVDHDGTRLEKQVHVQTIINMYRVRGHLIADLDPLAIHEPRMHPELDPATYGLTLWDLEREFLTDGLAGRETMTLGDILGILRDAYCRTVGVEYMHIQDPDQKRWIQEHVEGVPANLSAEEQRHILFRLNAAEAFERFLHTKYVGQKRFGLEGGESAIALIDAALDEAARAGLSEAVMGMAHRGRLNVLANIVGKSYEELFREFEGDIDPNTVQGSGDVKYHKGASGKFVGLTGVEIPVTLASNPSHLEAVDPVVEGMTRAKQDLLDSPGRFPVLSLLIHGDAAFAGQGVVAETFNLSQLRGYRTGGTIHLVINNQLGFTTSPESARSSVYATDVAKMVQAPIFHVNGDDPEACVRVARLAMKFRQTFYKDVVIDMVCYRRYGHNEGDEPSYTQPQMYERIDRHRSVRKLYTEALVRRGDITLEEAEKALEDFSQRLQVALDETRSSAPPRPTSLPVVVRDPRPLPPVETRVARSVLDLVAEAVVRPSRGFTVHPKLERQLKAHADLYAAGEVDWALAESMAFGSLLMEGTDVRLSGQDTRRGTFSQRHAVLVDYHTGEERVPLAVLSGPDGQRGRFFIYDSLLSEYAAAGFEYGYSVVHRDALVAWEAQFGDFVNGAQVVIDQFIVAAEDKWGQSSGLVLLLPHGYEGQGPEHSSARLERFLTLAAGGNISVANCTTSAQYFHLLRSQARRPVKVPLVVMTPKSLLRARASRSPIADLTDGCFSMVLDDRDVPDPEAVERVILCSGKVAYDVMARRDATGGKAAVVRVEQLYPWPEAEVAAALDRYPNAKDVYWVQEEPENMGAWSFVHGRLHRLLRDRFALTHVSRGEAASPATGSTAIHQLESDDLLNRALAGL
ncbi:MAG TPA: multifunctional oxoglutarate decarboxylase/oxoglutarate dehydrogenase thiamine pyrophosphate-binding subunit/dihydrolipoyllysine-residue succinyltransferase subunit [Acidimicrobiales bacterium]|nr:multifunctional oxoglutarate decarboxylase/oxoglutarate dehydrogenase thiamine pyrophosphate-binding subunit/dihydrolipoyllysine-residue succinyltransferase subunit [Acidimicrobiales bacterium]